MVTPALAALADPTRRAILGRLVGGPATVGELAGPFRISQQAVSKHIAYLERAGLVEKHREGRRRICTLNAAPLEEVASWVAPYRRFWEQRLDRLDLYLQQLKTKAACDDRRPPAT